MLERGCQIGWEFEKVLGSACLAVGVHLLEVDAGALEDAARASRVGGGREGVEGDGHVDRMPRKRVSKCDEARGRSVYSFMTSWGNARARFFLYGASVTHGS